MIGAARRDGLRVSLGREDFYGCVDMGQPRAPGFDLFFPGRECSRLPRRAWRGERKQRDFLPLLPFRVNL